MAMLAKTPAPRVSAAVAKRGSPLLREGRPANPGSGRRAASVPQSSSRLLRGAGIPEVVVVVVVAAHGAVADQAHRAGLPRIAAVNEGDPQEEAARHRGPERTTF